MKQNHLTTTFEAISENERVARIIAAAFVTECNPNLEELDDLKTAVSEAVTNCIIHGYDNEKGEIQMELFRKEREICVVITDYGKGIEDVKKAMEPLFTTKGQEERSGMGFSFMEAFMDSVEVRSKPGEGTVVTMTKEFGKKRL